MPSLMGSSVCETPKGLVEFMVSISLSMTTKWRWDDEGDIGDEKRRTRKGVQMRKAPDMLEPNFLSEGRIAVSEMRASRRCCWVDGRSVMVRRSV